MPPAARPPARGTWFFFFLRWLERHLSISTLYALLRPFAFARATLNTAFRNPRTRQPLPAGLQTAWSRHQLRRRRLQLYMDRHLMYFPDRLADPKWRDRCTLVGHQQLRQLRVAGHPAVLAFCHFGSVHLTRYWLRANGIPCAAVTGGKSGKPRELHLLTEHLIASPHIPIIFKMDQLKEASRFLAAGNLLFISLDRPEGRQLDVPFGDGWTMQMATGAVRLAHRHQAELIPCTILDEGPWRYRVVVGRPVPPELLADESAWPRAGAHLIAEMLPHFQSRPDQCGGELHRCLRKN